jgi:hypothetical protein
MLYSAIFLFGISAQSHAADPALEMLQAYESNDSHPDLENLIEAVALDRLDARIALLPAQVHDMYVADMVDRHTRWFYPGLPLSKAIPNLRTLTIGESAEKALAVHLLMPAPNWSPKWIADSSVISVPESWYGPKQPDRLLGEKHSSTVLRTLHPTTGKHFKVVPAETRIGMEHGVSGNGNGYIDPGEWFQIELAIKPIGKAIFFSTSAMVTSSHPCVWAVQEGEQVISEFRLDRAAKPINMWMYVSEDCQPGSRIELALTVTETKLGQQIDTIPISFTVQPGPSNIGIQTNFDYDNPGSSEVGTPAFQPGRSAEISVDMMASSAQGVRVAQRHQLPLVVGGLTAMDGEKPYPMERKGERWAAGNDLDFSLEDNDIVGPWLSKMSRSWANGSDPQIAVSAEMVFSPLSSEPKEPKARLKIALAAFREQLSSNIGPAQQIAGHKDLVYLEKYGPAAYERPSLASSKEMLRLVDELVASTLNPTPWVGQYRFRRVYMVPIDYKPVYVPPPPPPQVAAPPRPPPVVPVKEVEYTTFAMSLSRFSPDILERDEDDDESTLNESGVVVRLLFGKQFQVLLDGGGLSDGTTASHAEVTGGVRYNLLFLPQIRMGPHAAVGIRYLSALGVVDGGFMGHAGWSIDVFPIKNVGLWVQASAATPSPTFVGKDTYRIAVMPRRILWGIEVAF